MDIKTFITIDDFREARPSSTLTDEEIQECIYTTGEMLDGLCSGLISKVITYNYPENPDTNPVVSTNPDYRTEWELNQLKSAFYLQIQYVSTLGNDFTAGSGSLASGGLSASFQRPERKDIYAPGVREALANARVFKLQHFYSDAFVKPQEAESESNCLDRETAENTFVSIYQPKATIGNIAMVSDNNTIQFADPNSVPFNTIQAQTIWDSQKQAYVPIEQISNNAWISGTEKNVYTPDETDNKIQEIFDKYYSNILKIIQYNVGQVIAFKSDYDYQQFKLVYDIDDSYFNDYFGADNVLIYKEVGKEIYKTGVLNPEILFDKADKEYVDQQLTKYVTLNTEQTITAPKKIIKNNALTLMSQSNSQAALVFQGRHTNNVLVNQRVLWKDNNTNLAEMKVDNDQSFIIDGLANDIWLQASNGANLSTVNGESVVSSENGSVYLECGNNQRLYTNFTKPTQANDLVVKEYVDNVVNATVNMSNYYTKPEANQTFLSKTGYVSQTVDGTVTFQNVPNAPNAVNDLDLMNKQSVNTAINTAIGNINLSNYVTTNTNQNIAGNKVFTGQVAVPTPNSNNQATPKSYVDSQITNKTSNFVKKGGVTLNNSKYTIEQYQDNNTGNWRLFVKNLKIVDVQDNLDWSRPMTVKSGSRWYTVNNVTYIAVTTDNTGASDYLELGIISIYPFASNNPTTLQFCNYI